MPTISKIRFVNVVYEKGNKRYNDSTFYYDGHNGVIVLENGAGKTVYIQAALQAILPHVDMGKRKVRNTFSLEGEAMHVAIEWLISDKPKRQYAVTAATLYLKDGELKSQKYVYEYMGNDPYGIDEIPFVRENQDKSLRAASKGEMMDYYQQMNRTTMLAKTFAVTKEFHAYIEEHLKIIPEEWQSIAKINGEEGGIEAYFEGCSTTTQLVERLLIPSIEQALGGEGQVNFAEIFEKHREHVKKYQELKKVIEDSEKVKDKMKSYVDQMTCMHAVECDYDTQLGYAKSLAQFVADKCQEEKTRLEEIDVQEVMYEQILQDLKQQKALCELTDKYDKMKQQEQALQVAMTSYQEGQIAYTNHVNTYTCLEIAKRQQQIQVLSGEITGLTKQLERHDEETDSQGLKAELDANAGMLHGLYVDVLHGIEKEYNTYQGQQSRYQVEKADLEKQCNLLMGTIADKRDAKVKCEAQLDEKNKALEVLATKLVIQNTEGEIARQRQADEKKIAEHEDEVVALEEKNRQLKKEKRTAADTLEAMQQAMTTLEKSISEMSQQKEHIATTEAHIVESLKKRIPQCYNVDKVYMKQEQILGTLHDVEQQLFKEKEGLLEEERQVKHFLDFYGEQQVFGVEPCLESFVQKNQTQFDYLQQGVRYVEMLCETEEWTPESCYKQYAGWVETLITTEAETEKLKEKLEKLSDTLMYPVTVLDIQTVKQLLQGKHPKVQKVYPSTWSRYLTRERFEEAIQESTLRAAKIEALRVTKENELTVLNSQREQVVAFLEQYPYTMYQALGSTLEGAKKQLRDEKEAYTQLQSRTQALESVVEQNQEQLKQLNEAIWYLNERVTKAREYLSIEREKEKLYQLSREHIKVLEGLEHTKQELQKEQRIINELLADCSQALAEYALKKQQIQADAIYQEVQNTPLQPATEAMATLKALRMTLLRSLEKQQGNRGDIVLRINEKRMQQAKCEEEITQIRQSKTYKEPVTLQYDAVEADRLAKLVQLLPVLEVTQTKLDNEVRRLDKLYIQAKTQYDEREKEYKRKYTHVEAFVEDTVYTRDVIGKKEQEVYVAKEKTEVYKKQTQERHKLWEQQDTLLMRKNERYGFLAPEIREALIEENERVEMSYTIEQHVRTTLEALEQSKKKYVYEQKQLYQEKEAFIRFCSTEIKEVKLCQLAIQGVQGDKTYEQTLGWYSNLVERIETTMRYQEDTMREHDKQMNQFVIHVYTYLETIATELGRLHKKTKLKTEEGSKYFCEIMVPEWKEEEAKLKIRTYINEVEQMIEQKYQHAILDKEAQAEIKKFIANKFKVTRLMDILVGISHIKVKCRKAVSAGSISSRMFSWEESNEWSGGEKWSKNMALFLGILNYIAEKKQNTYTTDKISRAVILDNPFGKASSDHVLEPVFFIASQLGFQIIALTAHGEGDFIRKYFPIVYSCKLRQAKDAGTTLVTIKQEMNKAYFREISPVTLLRLGTGEQLDLF